nr:hypothetical protein [Rhodothermus marinus]
MAAACLGFLWYNGYPAQVFMGDTGALALGAAVGTLALMVKKRAAAAAAGRRLFRRGAFGDHSDDLFQIHALAHGHRTPGVSGGAVASSL